ncbi:MAG: glycosyltransferase [Cetobacterium sp.]
MKKIYFILPSLNFGGGEKVIVNIANNMDLKKYEVKIISLKKGSDFDKEINDNIEIVKFNKSRVVLGCFKLIKFLRKNKPDIIFSGAGDVNIILGFFKNITFLKNIKIIGRERGVISKIFDYKNSNLKIKIIKFLYKNFLKNLEILIVQSETMKKEFEEYLNIDKKKIKIFYNPLDFKMIEKKIENITNLELSNSKIYLISVGRLEDVKNHLKMLDIFKYLDKNKYILNIIGDGKNFEKIQKKIRDLSLEENVNLLGFSDNPYKYLKKSDVLLITSTQEALPNVALEANACGCYVLGLDCPGGMREIIKNNENGNILYSIEEMANILQQLEFDNELREKLIKFSKKYDIKNYIKILEKML